MNKAELNFESLIRTEVWLSVTVFYKDQIKYISVKVIQNPN